MIKYNIAFVPKSTSRQFIELSREKKVETHTYCLGENSIPHVTICQFHLEKQDIDCLWKQVCLEVSGSIHLSFKKYSHLSFNQLMFWLSLLPEETEVLHRIFNVISKKVKPLKNDTYDPHLTLFNYMIKPNLIRSKITSAIYIDDDFDLVLGECDDHGQLTAIIRQFENAYKTPCRINSC